MPLSPLLLLHVCSAIVGLLSGAVAMAFRKTSGLHRIGGNIFSMWMLSMSASAAYTAAFIKPNMMNVVIGLLTFYLVAAAWWAARRRDGGTGIFDLGALLFVLAVGAGGVALIGARHGDAIVRSVVGARGLSSQAQGAAR